MTIEPGKPARRRLSQETGRSRLPIGCMAWGAVLGIIAGIMVAVYALPPILRSIYGEETISRGEAFEADGKRIEVISVDRNERVFSIVVLVRSSQAWAMTGQDWKLEISTEDDWAHPLAPDPAVEATSFAIVPGEERTLLLRFAAPGRADAHAVKLHLANPRVALELE